VSGVDHHGPLDSTRAMVLVAGTSSITAEASSQTHQKVLTYIGRSFVNDSSFSMRYPKDTK